MQFQELLVLILVAVLVVPVQVYGLEIVQLEPVEVEVLQVKIIQVVEEQEVQAVVERVENTQGQDLKPQLEGQLTLVVEAVVERAQLREVLVVQA
jgi:hypothetical protein